MLTFILTVTTEGGATITLPFIAASSVDVHTSALDMFGICKITVRPR